MSTEKTRYSDEELEEFRTLINKKLEKAKKEYDFLQEAIRNPNEHGDGDRSSSNQMLEDSSVSSEKESLSQLADRQRKFIDNLEKALIRIENKTYGICKASGKLISKDRLKAVPHTTMSIEAKQGNK